MTIRSRTLFLVAIALPALLAPNAAPASMIVGRATTSESLRVDASGQAQIAWTAGGRRWSAVLERDRLRFGRTVCMSTSGRAGSAAGSGSWACSHARRAGRS